MLIHKKVMLEESNLLCCQVGVALQTICVGMVTAPEGCTYFVG